MSVDALLDELLRKEGGYVFNPNDRGGETNFGITAAVARENGYSGPMKDLPLDFAKRIYLNRYWTGPKFDRVNVHTQMVAEELFDTGVNMGPGVAARFLQRALNLFNRRGEKYPDVGVDGAIGPATLSALRSFLDERGKTGEMVLLKTLNCLQGYRYIELAEDRKANEDFVFGWINNRVGL